MILIIAGAYMAGSLSTIGLLFAVEYRRHNKFLASKDVKNEAIKTAYNKH
mgnify:FL=1